MSEMLERIQLYKGLEVEHLGVATLRIAPQPFSAEGVMRWPFFAKLLQGPPNMADDAFDSDAAAELFPPHTVEDFVVKRFKDPMIEPGRSYSPGAHHSQKKYDSQMEVQSVAAALAVEFNHVGW